MKSCFALVFLAISAAAEMVTEFEIFKAEFGKTYSSAVDEEFRQKIFLENLQIVNDHNALYAQGNTTFSLAINEFADLTNAEFSERYNGLRQPDNNKHTRIFAASGVAVPNFVDWRRSGYVTKVKNQGGCGSCWAFSATGALEGQHRKSTGYLIELSEQNLVDCSRSQGNNGCNGGWMNNAFNYVIANGGIDTETSYPYEARDGTCRFNRYTIGATARNFVNVPRGNENALKEACAIIGPISVAIDASGRGFQFYTNGVYNNPSCTQTVNHGVLIVGYGTENGVDYWLCKNSWGTNWGDQGYIKMSRNKNNQCAIASYASYPLV